jgi:hypothetical protein
MDPLNHHNHNDDDDIYNLETVIDILEEIRLNDNGYINYPRALHCLALEIADIRDMLDEIMEHLIKRQT